MKTVMFPVLLVFAVFEYATSQGPDCSNLMTLPNMESRDGNFQSPTGVPYLQDRDIIQGWYAAPNGRTLLDEAPGYQRCGTKYPIWRRSSSNGVSEMCIQVSYRKCLYSFPVKTSTCFGKEVYELLPTLVPTSAYCFGPPATTGSPSPSAPEFLEKPTVEYELNTLVSTSELNFMCSFTKHPDDVYYRTYWSVDDTSIDPPAPAEKWTNGDVIKNQALTETQLREASVTVYGIRVSCSVRASFTTDGLASVPVPSDWRFIGIKVSPTSVVLGEGDSADITLQLTAPFGCGPSADCSLNVKVSTIDNPEACDEYAAISTSCKTAISSSQWDKPVKVKVVGGITNQYGSSSRVLSFNLTTSIGDVHDMWDGYNLGLVTVQLTKDNSMIQRKSCYSINDPHMKTFDGRRYEHHYGGIFTMYRHKELPIEVQIKTFKCGERAWCNCGVAVRAGRTVFEFNKCDNQFDRWILRYTFCDDGGDVLQVKKRGSDYEVYLPTGGKVKVNVWYKYLGVYIYPSVLDIEKSDGLCGFLSGKCDDDFYMRDGTYSSDTSANENCGYGSTVWVNLLTTFSESWRVPSQEDLFDHDTHSNLEKWPKGKTFCKCQSKDLELDCTASAASESCNKPYGFKDVPPSKCSIKERRKRSPKAFQSPAARQKRQTPPSWTNGWTEASARAHCDQLFKDSSSVQVCKNIAGVETNGSLNNCFGDIFLTGSSEFGEYSLDIVRSQCLHEVTVNPALTSVREEVVAKACPNDCSGHGSCKNGECQCVTNYGGDDCSVDINTVPVLSGIEYDGHCDTSLNTCNNISVYGQTFIEGAKCLFIGCKVSSYGGYTNCDYQWTTGTVESIGEVNCNISAFHDHRRRVKRLAPTDTDDETFWGYYISVSNNGWRHTSNYVVLLIYDGTCVTAGVHGFWFGWSIQGQYCIHDGVCYEHGKKRLDRCLKCNGTSNTWETDPFCP